MISAPVRPDRAPPDGRHDAEAPRRSPGAQRRSRTQSSPGAQPALRRWHPRRPHCVSGLPRAAALPSGTYPARASRPGGAHGPCCRRRARQRSHPAWRPPEEEGNEVSLHDCITGAHTTSALPLLPWQSAAPSLTSMWPRTTRRAHVLPSCAFAAAATWSGSKPNFLWSSLSGADAPNVCMPIMRPALPT